MTIINIEWLNSKVGAASLYSLYKTFGVSGPFNRSIYYSVYKTQLRIQFCVIDLSIIHYIKHI